MEGGLLYRLHVREGETWSQLVVPQVSRDRVLSLGHESIMSGHLGTRKTSDRIVNCFYWPGIVRDIKRFFQSCDICRRTADRGSVRRVPVQITPLVEVVALVAILDPVVDTSLEVEPLLGEGTENIGDVNICESLTEGHSAELRVLLQQYEAIFSEKPGHTSLVKHSIHLITDKPVRVKPYPIPYAKLSTIE